MSNPNLCVKVARRNHPLPVCVEQNINIAQGTLLQKTLMGLWVCSLDIRRITPFYCPPHYCEFVRFGLVYYNT